jgi:hypothetical protein
VIAKPVQRLAELAGFAIADDRRFLLVEEDGVGPEHPFSGEKLSMVLAGGPRVTTENVTARHFLNLGVPPSRAPYLAAGGASRSAGAAAAA